jgi:uncharacterized protein YgiM (DUF1202 family)
MQVIRAGLRTSAPVAVCAALLVGLVATPTAGAASRATASETLNVRSGPGTTYRVVGTLNGGRSVTVLSTSKGWSKIRFNDQTAYIASRYLVMVATPRAAAPAPGKVTSGSVRTTTTAVNLRKGADVSYPLITVVPPGTRGTLTGRSAGGFAELYAAGSLGWISTQYLAPTTALPAVIGTRVATAALDIRTASGAGSKTLSEVRKGTRLSITGVIQNGRAQVVLQGAARWVTAKYLEIPRVSQPRAPRLPAVTGTRYATAPLDIRSSSADDYTAIAEVPVGAGLSITGVVQNGRMQVVYGKAARWVTARYLSTRKPTTTSPASYAVERGLRPNAIRVHRAALARFPQIRTYYGVRKDPIPDHPSGHALDLMIPGYTSRAGRALGSEVAAWARANARSLGIQYVIWNQHIWNIQRDKEGWRYMADRGGDSANHKNHVHVTVYG